MLFRKKTEKCRKLYENAVVKHLPTQFEKMISQSLTESAIWSTSLLS